MVPLLELSDWAFIYQKVTYSIPEVLWICVLLCRVCVTLNSLVRRCCAVRPHKMKTIILICELILNWQCHNCVSHKGCSCHRCLNAMSCEALKQRTQSIYCNVF